jgi:ABC-type nitrate/sulfonate/bicarbonate transport system substrate-binding protein
VSGRKSIDEAGGPARVRLLMRAAAAALVIGFGGMLESRAGAAEPAVPSPCAHMDTIKIQEYAGSIQNLVAWVAIAEGFMRAHCLDAEMVQIPSAPAAFASSIHGAVDFISTSPETAYIPAAQGFDIKLVAAFVDTVNYALVIGKNVPLPHLNEGYPALMRDLVGKKIGSNQFGSATDELARANFQAAGLDPAQANWVAYGPPAAGLAALSNGSLDAAEFFGDGMDVAQAAIGGRIVGDLRDPATQTLPVIKAMRGASVLWAAQTSYIDRNPDRIHRFIQANNEAVDWIRDPKNFDAIVKLVALKAPSPEGIADRQALLLLRVRRYIPQVNHRVSMRSLQAWSDWAVSEKRIPKPADLDALVWKDARAMLVP